MHPINTGARIGAEKFQSFFNPGASAPLKATEGGEYAEITKTTKSRGVIIAKDDVDDLSKGYVFQFNPQTLSDDKTVNYTTRNYTGVSYEDYIWTGGGERVMSFQLFLDNTPQSHTAHFGPERRNHKESKLPLLDGKVVKHQNGSNNPTLDPRYPIPVLSDRSLTPPSVQYSNSGAFSLTRISERGVLDEVEFLQSFMYPASKKGRPNFAEGGFMELEQFRPPATVVFAYGPFYLEGVIKRAPANYTLFDKDLTPIRATVDIEFAVYQFINTVRKIKQ